MKTPEEFEEFCESRLLPIVRRLQSRQNRIQIRFCVVLLLAMVALLYASRASGIAFVATVLFIISRAIRWIVLDRSWRRDCAHELLREIAPFCMPSLTFRPFLRVSPASVEKSAIFLSSGTEFETCGLFQNDTQGSGLEFCRFEVDESSLRYMGSLRSSHGRRQNKFMGFFLAADFRRPGDGAIVIRPDIAERLLGRLGQRLQKAPRTGLELVKLEDPEFEREFVVFADDQIEARYVLTPASMERLVRLRTEAGGPLFLTFKGQRVFAAAHMGRRPFEFTPLARPFGVEAARRLFDDVQLPLKVLHALRAAG